MLSPFDVETYIEDVLSAVDAVKGEMTDKEVKEFLDTWFSNIDLSERWVGYVGKEGDGTL